MGAYRIGIDLGGTNIAAGIVDENLRIIKKASIPTAAPRGAKEICCDMVSLSRRLCEEADLSFGTDIGSIGIVPRVLFPEEP